MKIWITGIAGFLGSHLADSLLSLGHQVHGNDNFLCGSIDNIPMRDIGSSLIARDDIQDKNDWRLDCCDFEYMKSGLDYVNPDVLIHCAATAHEGLSNFSPSFITKNIYEASVSTFSAAIASGVKRIIFMSSMARYGSQTLPFHEAQTPHPVDPYGIAKVAAEDTLKALCKLHNVEYVIAVPHNIIGIRQRYCDPYRNVASIMINRTLQGKSIIVYGNGSQKRCFSPIADCLDSLVKMIEAPISGETINIGPDGHNLTILYLAELIRDKCWKYTKKLPIQFVDARPNEVMEAYCSSSKARKLLGFSPKQSIEDCLDEMIEHIHMNGPQEFEYSLPIEIEKGCPKTWTEHLI